MTLSRSLMRWDGNLSNQTMAVYDGTIGESGGGACFALPSAVDIRNTGVSVVPMLGLMGVWLPWSAYLYCCSAFPNHKPRGGSAVFEASSTRWT